MKRLVSFLLTVLLLGSCAFAQTNTGIKTRTTAPLDFNILPSSKDTIHNIFNLRVIAEQGFATFELMVDQTDTFSAWVRSGNAVYGWFSVTDTSWSEPLQVIFAEIIADCTLFSPVNIAHLQSVALVDNSDRKVGYIPACDLFDFMIAAYGISIATDTTKGKIVINFK